MITEEISKEKNGRGILRTEFILEEIVFSKAHFGCALEDEDIVASVLNPEAFFSRLPSLTINLFLYSESKNSFVSIPRRFEVREGSSLKRKEEERKKQEHEEKLKKIARKEAEEAHKRKVEQMESKEYLRAKELQERIRQRLGINEQEHEEKLRKEAEEAHKRKVEQMESKEYLRAKELQERLRQRIRQINEKEKAKQEHE
ncbi:hypothetical protein RhiirA1_435935 [Rhizophagus irregularis]|uniref:Uncharacterized protein n=2 Tax=Rhizophagus irregularis TaxID=588596 RepID=A0A2N0SJZ0_9GLOM|nr:hypothetical protein RhiirA1_435935 [Rhizophagus irregularis]